MKDPHIKVSSYTRSLVMREECHDSILQRESPTFKDPCFVYLRLPPSPNVDILDHSVFDISLTGDLSLVRREPRG